MYDLHLHSVYSDGCLTPFEICKIAKERGLNGVSLTDHDTVDGLSEMENACFSYNLEFVPGIEFGITYNGTEIHILGHYIDYKDSRIIDIIAEMKSDRKIRIKKMIDKLKNYGVCINYNDVLKFSKRKIISRTHIAQTLVKKNICIDISQAFQDYLIPGKPGYVEKKEIGVTNIIDIINKTGGIPILAHPSTINDDTLIPKLIKYGIKGIEIINSKHTYNDIVRYNNICNIYNLIKTVGSDCHGRTLYDNDLLIGNYYLNRSGFERIKELKGRIDYGK